MRIIDLQRRLREVGRIRIGEQVPTSNGKTRPKKLEHFRLTSADQLVIEAAAEVWGGTAKPWEGAPVGEQWEVYTETKALPVVVPPGDLSFSQSYEQWSAGGCKVRCDGRWDHLADKACHCDPENRACDIHTRLSVMLPDLPGVGIWRLDTQGYYAAVELGGIVDLVAAHAERGIMLPARLRLDQRSVKRVDRGKVVTRNFVVPVLDLDVHPLELGRGAPPSVSLDAGAQAAIGPAPITPVPPPDGLAAPTVAEQMAQVGEPTRRPARANAAAPIPATGMAPRTAREAAGTGSVPSGEGAKQEPPAGDDEQLANPQARRASRAQQIAIRAREAEVDRAQVISAVTGGAKTSGRDLSEDEGLLVLDALRRMIAGELRLEQDDEGWVLVDAPQVPNSAPDGDGTDEEPLQGEFLDEPVVEGAPGDGPGWRALIKGRGVTWTAALRRAVELSRELEVPAPTDASSLAESDPRLRAALLAWLEAGT